MTADPLAGCRVLVTRPAEQAGGLAQAIADAGGEAILFPVISISGREPQAIALEFAAIPSADVIVFVSSNAVRFGLDACRQSAAKIAAIGPATQAALQEAGVVVDIAPEEGFDSEHLLLHPALQDMHGGKILIVRGETGRELLGDTLAGRGAEVSYLSTYRRMPHRPPDDVIATLDASWRNGAVDFVTVMSVETLTNLLQVLPPASLEALRQTPLVAPGKRVIQTACELVPGIPAIIASGPAAADMVNALIEGRHSGKNS